MSGIRTTATIVLIAAFLGLVCLLAAPVIASPGTGDVQHNSTFMGMQCGNMTRPAAHAGGPGGNMTGLLDRLEEKGYDVSAIKAAVESGDKETARTLLGQFMQEHKDALPAPPAGKR